ncbi:MAG: nitroreductase family protein [Victivallaceae bacterium]|nr:nitroreductase family protein [Victivallaceae bacterium]
MNIKTAIKGRRTVRRFSQKTVSADKIKQLIDAGRVAACGGNMQRLRYVVVQDDKELLGNIFDTTAWGGFVQPKRNPVPGETAPTAFLVLTCKPDDATGAAIDAGAAIANIQLMAYALGLGCCWIGAYKHERVDSLLELDGMQSVFLVALGYPAESPVMEDIGIDDPAPYYLDADDVLHVPKYSVEAITEWR